MTREKSMGRCAITSIINERCGTRRPQEMNVRLLPGFRQQNMGLAVAWIALASLFIVSGCQSPEKHYALHGRVVAKDASAMQVTVNHQYIPGFMPAMTMPYPVKDSQALDAVEPGDQISADVVVQNKDAYWLDHLVITDQTGRGSVPATTVAHELAPGDAVPDVPLINQDGKALHLRQFKGQAVLLTFIYTRCPLPTFCPLISSEFAAIHKELKTNPDDVKRTHLISVSLDPAYDTPPVLRKYGLAYLQDDASGFKHWDFVSTNPQDLETLAAAFGLQYSEQDNQIAHSMETVLLAPNGTVAKSWSGNEWKTAAVLAAVKQTETSPQ
jgi:protein SCO1